MTNLKPSEVRALMMRELEGLRGILDRIALAADSAECDRSVLCPCIVELRDRLNRYLEQEDALLRPALEATDFWGPKRLQGMQAEHAPHCDALRDLAEAAARHDVDVGDLVRRVKILHSALHRDFDDDERSLLIAEVLQDDATCTDQSDG